MAKDQPPQKNAETLWLELAGKYTNTNFAFKGSGREKTWNQRCGPVVKPYIYRTKAGPMVRPSVSLLPPSSEQLSGDSATLACLLTAYSPQGAVVSWEVDGTEVTEGVLSSSEEEKSGRYSSSSTLSLSQERWMKGELYSCRVLHHDHRQSQSFRRSQCQG